MNGVFIALGANLGNPAETFRRALVEIGDRIGPVLTTSSLWRSPAWPPGSYAPDYTNAVIAVDAMRTAEDVLSELHVIEERFGRVRSEPNAPRDLDLDLIAYHEKCIDNRVITLPHPRMKDRPFVLLPLSEIAPDFIHPLSKHGIGHMLARLPSHDVLAHRRLGPMLAFADDSH